MIMKNSKSDKSGKTAVSASIFSKTLWFFFLLLLPPSPLTCAAMVLIKLLLWIPLTGYSLHSAPYRSCYRKSKDGCIKATAFIFVGSVSMYSRLHPMSACWATSGRSQPLRVDLQWWDVKC
jgi:hypothetical protein